MRHASPIKIGYDRIHTRTHALPHGESQPSQDWLTVLQVPYEHWVAWLSLVHRIEVTGWHDDQGWMHDVHPPPNVATFLVDVTGLNPEAFNQNRVIDVDWLRRHRPDLTAQWSPPAHVKKLWVVSRVSTPDLAYKKLQNQMKRDQQAKSPDAKKKQNGGSKPQPRRTNSWDSEHAVLTALRNKGAEMRRAGDLPEGETLEGRVVAVHSDKDPCEECEADLKERVPESAQMFSTARHGKRRPEGDRSADAELYEAIEAAAPAATQARAFNDDGVVLPPRGTQARLGAGGVDFSTLELSYLSDAPSDGSREISYAFSGVPRKGSPQTSGRSVHDMVSQTSDAFFVWLALPRSSFWVNLNPNEPNRIIEKNFGRTDAGRILLEADLEMKRMAAKLSDPRTRLGKRYWSRLRGRSKCVSSRTWIIPGRATVRDTGDELHILKAPLRVRMESSILDEQGTGEHSSCPGQPKTVQKHNEKMHRRMITRRVERAVNTAPEYADLRRVYLARIAAEWVRERHGSERTAYDSVINSEDIRRWVSSTRGWRPRETFRAYVRSYVKGEYRMTERTRRGNRIYTTTYKSGGVDFSTVQIRNVSQTAFDKNWPDLSRTARKAIEQTSKPSRGDRVWFGGQTESRAAPVAPIGDSSGSEAANAATEAGSGEGWLLPVGGALLVAVSMIVRRVRRDLSNRLTGVNKS